MNGYNVLELLKAVIWDKSLDIIDEEIYTELKQHAIIALLANNIALPISDEYKIKWQKDVLQQLFYYTRYKYQQDRLPITVPYVILKGTSAAQYYLHPEYRTMGDIDIITRREDFDTANRELKENGYVITKISHREAAYIKNGITIELHRYFASLNDPVKAKYLDDLIINSINPSHVLPDPVNGLVLLEHISQHLENGLGLRQIIDWMMFVDKCLPDDKWPEFREFAQNIGLERLAIITTRMCEIFLGLPERRWCSDANENLCQQLMDYILSCGNFGNKKNSDEEIAEDVFAKASTPKMLFKTLQTRGLVNWKASRRHPVLKRFAWIYQAFRYLGRGMFRKDAISKLKSEHDKAVKRNAMFEALGVKTAAKGLAVYRDGEYVKL